MINIENIDFEKGGGLVPCIIQDTMTRQVLMLGYMNKETLKESVRSGRVTFWSRSKKRLWTKGEISGNVLSIDSIISDCDNDSLLILANPNGPICHTGCDTCWGMENKKNSFYFEELQSTIKKRYEYPTEASYTSSLFKAGINKIAQKVGEEAVELIIESKDEDKELFLNEAADLMFHFIVLLIAKGFELADVVTVLQKRAK